MDQKVYPFSAGNRTMSDLLGGKGANLAEMATLGIPVPDGFTITTRVCQEYLRTGGLTDDLLDEIDQAIMDLEKKIGKSFGDPTNPLLVSVRSGAKFSMPGMMETVLNVGMSPEVAATLERSLAIVALRGILIADSLRCSVKQSVKFHRRVLQSCRATD